MRIKENSSLLFNLFYHIPLVKLMVSSQCGQAVSMTRLAENYVAGKIIALKRLVSTGLLRWVPILETSSLDMSVRDKSVLSVIQVDGAHTIHWFDFVDISPSPESFFESSRNCSNEHTLHAANLPLLDCTNNIRTAQRPHQPILTPTDSFHRTTLDDEFTPILCISQRTLRDLFRISNNYGGYLKSVSLFYVENLADSLLLTASHSDAYDMMILREGGRMMSAGSSGDLNVQFGFFPLSHSAPKFAIRWSFEEQEEMTIQ